MPEIPVESWGRLTRDAHDWQALTQSDAQQVAAAIGASQPGIAYGAGRSYGDVALNPGGTLWATRGLDRFIDFDAQNGVLTCEAGVLLRDVQRTAIARGWMLPVSPGTQMVTVGGAIANDVHGKSHHSAGSFGQHVRSLRLARTDGQVMDAAPQGERADWFAATVGGLGLTGVITQASLQLEPIACPWFDVDVQPFASLAEFMALNAETAAQGWAHTVSWIDCLRHRDGSTRGIFMRGNLAQQAPDRRAPRKHGWNMPFTPPFSLINPVSLRLFNLAYYHAHRLKAGKGQAYYVPFLYPLDHIQNWNRFYGPRGFYQYQSVVPHAGGAEAVQAMLDAIGASGQGSFLAVLKTMGDTPSAGMLGFAMPGITLALDFPNRGADTLALFERLDAIVHEAGGRIYLAKDARWPRKYFEAAYPRLGEFLPYRDPGISSALSRRLMGSQGAVWQPEKAKNGLP